MIARSFRLAFVVLALVVHTASAAPVPLEHKDERVGFKMQTPREWTAIPQSTDERWIVGKYLAHKSDFYTEKGGGWTAEHRAEMQMIAFVADGAKERFKLQEKVGRDGKREVIVEIDSPFKNYKEFLAKRYSGGGFYLSDEKESKVGDVPVTCLEYKVERMSQEGPKRLITWIYHVPDVDLAVQFECLESALPKLNTELQRCFKSFKTIARTAGNLAEVSTPGRTLSFKDLEELPPEERKLHRTAMEREAHKKATAGTPEGWTAKKFGRFLVINHTDDKYAKQLTDNAEAVLNWLDDTLPFVGKDEYVRAPILRIYKNFDELQSFAKDAEWSPANLEIVTYQDHAGTLGYSMKMVNQQVMRLWFYDRDLDLSLTLPPWLSAGLRELVGNLRSKGGKVEFLTNQWIRDSLRDAKRKGRTSSPREIVTMGSESFRDDAVHVREACALVAFLMKAEGPTAKKTKDLLAEYLRHVKSTARAIDAEEEAEKKEKKEKPAATDGDAAAGGDDAKDEEEEQEDEEEDDSEEEEEKRYKQRQQAWKLLERRLLDESFRLTFGAWKEEDWETFDTAYEKFID